MQPNFDALSAAAKERAFQQAAVVIFTALVVAERATCAGAQDLGVALELNHELSVTLRDVPTLRIGVLDMLPTRYATRTVAMSCEVMARDCADPKLLRKARRAARSIAIEQLLVASIEGRAPVGEA